MKVEIRENFAHGNTEPSSALKPNALAKKGYVDVEETDSEYRVVVSGKIYTASKNSAEKMKNGVVMVQWQLSASQSL
ncbi:hypothetical protein [Phaeodactylibacter xiamenensis]|uniref:hypothetical protein n=1 Tax=Phaeodactylibacter xiamenensis TaxID=1524460 RepID=UPI003CCBDA70